MSIPLVDIKRQYEKYKNDFDRILVETASSTQFILGGKVKEFEENFAEYLGVRHVVGVGSGTDALKLALKAAGCKKGKKVITQNNTFIATTLAVKEAHGEIALCDTDETTHAMNISQEELEDTDFVIPVHLYGYPFNIDSLKELSPKTVIVEDACQAHGSSIEGRKCGSMGLAAAFSFYPGKNLGAFGDGGAVATNDDSLANELRLLRNWGSTVKYIHEREGGNSRLDTLQAAILDFKLSHLDEWNQQRNALVKLYRKNIGNESKIILPVEVSNSSFQNYHLFVIRLPESNRDTVLSELHKKEIFAGIHYPLPIHKQAVYSKYAFSKEEFPVSSMVADQIISLPLFPEMTEEEVDIVSETLLNIVRN